MDSGVLDGRLSSVPPVISTARLRLLPLAPSDIEDMLLIDADPEVMRFINGGRPTSHAAMAEWIARSVGQVWVARPWQSPEIVGWFSLRPTEPGHYELGYRLRRCWWGRGLATEGSAALVAMAFDELGAERVWAQTMTVNVASRHVMERCGLRFVRTFLGDWDEVIDGAEHGDVEYELRRHDWERVKGAPMATRLPPSAAWRHEDARHGFESVFIRTAGAGHRFEGHTAAVEDGRAWAVHYVIEVDGDWRTRRAAVRAWSESGQRELVLQCDGSGRWLVDGAQALELDGCLDVDLESSTCTNAIPVLRMRLAVGQRADAPAVFVRAVDLAVERLEQSYARAGDDPTGHHCYDYVSPAFDFACRLVYDRSGLVIDYPGLATRVL